MLCNVCSTRIIEGYFQRAHLNRSGRYHGTVIVNACTARCNRCNLTWYYAMSKLLSISYFKNIALWKSDNVTGILIPAPKEGINYLWA